MPCFCWFDPPESSKRFIKEKCQDIVNEIKRLKRIGDPLGISLDDTKNLLDHLYHSKSCPERPSAPVDLPSELPPAECPICGAQVPGCGDPFLLNAVLVR